MDDIMWPILQAALPKAAIQKRFPCKLVFGSLGFQGFGLHRPSNSQLIEHLQAIVTHSHHDPPSHDLHLQNMELVQCYVGSEQPFWDLPYQLHGHLAPKGWIQFTWEELSATNLSLRGPLATIPSNRESDVFIMDELVRRDWLAKSLQVLYPVRLYLGVTLLSQCCNAAGTYIHPNVWQCKHNTNILRSPHWPNFKAPTPTAMRAWQSMLTDVFIAQGNRYHQLARPLGLWKTPDDAEWVWWLDPTSGDIFERHPNLAWWKWRALPTHHQQRRFSLDGPTLDSPQLTSVRVSVGVTGCTLCLLSEAHVVPQVERPPPAMMYEALESLPHSCHWSVQHAEIADEGRAIAAAIRAGAAVAVSDGYLRHTLGTSTFVIKGMDSAHRTVG